MPRKSFDCFAVVLPFVENVVCVPVCVIDWSQVSLWAYGIISITSFFFLGDICLWCLVCFKIIMDSFSVSGIAQFCLWGLFFNCVMCVE